MQRDRKFKTQVCFGSLREEGLTKEFPQVKTQEGQPWAGCVDLVPGESRQGAEWTTRLGTLPLFQWPANEQLCSTPPPPAMKACLTTGPQPWGPDSSATMSSDQHFMLSPHFYQEFYHCSMKSQHSIFPSNFLGLWYILHNTRAFINIWKPIWWLMPVILSVGRLREEVH